MIYTQHLNSVLIRFNYKTMQAAGNSHTKSQKCQYSQHWPRWSST